MNNTEKRNPVDVVRDIVIQLDESKEMINSIIEAYYPLFVAVTRSHLMNTTEKRKISELIDTMDVAEMRKLWDISSDMGIKVNKWRNQIKSLLEDDSENDSNARYMVASLLNEAAENNEVFVHSITN